MDIEATGPRVTAWVCEYISGEVFVSLAANPMNDPDVRAAWRLFTMAERDEFLAAERERAAQVCQRLWHNRFRPITGDDETLTGDDYAEAILMAAPQAGSTRSR